MCEYCRHISYHGVGCPNAPDPPIVCECELCGEDICAGDEYFQHEDIVFCKACLRDYISNLDDDELIEALNIQIKDAEKEY